MNFDTSGFKSTTKAGSSKFEGKSIMDFSNLEEESKLLHQKQADIELERAK